MLVGPFMILGSYYWDCKVDHDLDPDKVLQSEQESAAETFVVPNIGLSHTKLAEDSGSAAPSRPSSRASDRRDAVWECWSTIASDWRPAEGGNFGSRPSMVS